MIQAVPAPATTKAIYGLLLLVLLMPILGQLQRIDVGSGAVLMIMDVAILALNAYYIFYKIAYNRQFQITRSGKILLTLWGVMLISLFFGSADLLMKEILVSTLYFGRFVSYTLLYFIAQDIVNSAERRYVVYKLMIISSFILALLGFLQLWIFPDFYALRWYQYGWDPHIGRLTSTWLDPNYIGGYFAGSIAVMLSMLVSFLQKRNWKYSSLLVIVITTLLIALMLTYSRSSYLALICGLAVLGLLRLRKLVLVTGIAAILLFSTSERLQERVSDAYLSFKALFTESTFALDDTARLRLESWQQGFFIFDSAPLLGIGYNTLKFKNMRYGFANVDEHASGGFDSSLLTILTTTGLVGLLCFLAFFTSIMAVFWKIYKYGSEHQPYLALGLISVCGALFIHSFFVNSLFFGFIMVPFFVLTGMLDQKNPDFCYK